MKSETVETWRADHPDLFFLNPEEPVLLLDWLRAEQVLKSGETLVSAERAGEGNMNCTVRVVTDIRSFIVKQARPWVEKYPQFAAPWDRALLEMEFYRLIGQHDDLAERMPGLLHAVSESRTMVLEDLGGMGDCSDLYQGATIEERDMVDLAEWLGGLHRTFLGMERPSLANREMRQLNGAHIFTIPLQRENGLDLDGITPGLGDEARRLSTDRRFSNFVEELRRLYHADGPCLLHGDFFPGSFLRTDGGIRVIDPEFAFFGRPEWDPAVLLAHLCLAGQSRETIGGFLASYLPPDPFDRDVMLQFAGVEIMRRLIGYAQLPLDLDLEGKRTLLGLARELVTAPSLSLLDPFPSSPP